jgi:hypothetical protein
MLQKYGKAQMHTIPRQWYICTLFVVYEFLEIKFRFQIHIKMQKSDFEKA